MFGLRKAYNINIPLNDTNVQNMSHKDWSHLVRHTFLELESESAINEKTNHLEFVLLIKPAAYLFYFDPQFSHVIFKVCTRMFESPFFISIQCTVRVCKLTLTQGFFNFT